MSTAKDVETLSLRRAQKAAMSAHEFNRRRAAALKEVADLETLFSKTRHRKFESELSMLRLRVEKALGDPLSETSTRPAASASAASVSAFLAKRGHVRADPDGPWPATSGFRVHTTAIPGVVLVTVLPMTHGSSRSRKSENERRIKEVETTLSERYAVRRSDPMGGHILGCLVSAIG